MTHDELEKAIKHTKEEIYRMKQQIEENNDTKEKRRLQRGLKELQYLQLWQLDQLG